MGYPVLYNQDDQPLLFLMVDSTDHITGKTGLSPNVNLRKAGGAFLSATGAITEIGSGWYQVAGNTMDTNTLGPLILHATASGADPCDEIFPVVAYNMLVAGLGLAGAGSTHYEITVQTSGSVAISGVEIWISTDAAGSNIVAGVLHTNDVGKVTFMLDSGVTYYMWRDHPDYQWTNPTSFTVP